MIECLYCGICVINPADPHTQHRCGINKGKKTLRTQLRLKQDYSNILLFYFTYIIYFTVMLFVCELTYS